MSSDSCHKKMLLESLNIPLSIKDAYTHVHFLKMVTICGVPGGATQV